MCGSSRLITEYSFQVAPLKARVTRTKCVTNKDVLSISVDETMPTDPVIMEEEASRVITTNNVPSETISIPSVQGNTIHNSQGNTCSTDNEQTTENQSCNNTETVSSPNDSTAVELESKDVVRKVEKNVQNKRNKNEISMEVTVESIPSITDGVSELVEFQSKGDTDVCEDMNTNVLNSTTMAEAKLGVEKYMEEDDKLNKQQHLHEETINSLPFKQTVIEKQHDEDVPQPITHTCHSTTDATFYEGVNHQENGNIIVEDISSECIVMTSPTPAQYDVTKQTDGLDPNVVHQQTCEGSVTTDGDSIPVGAHDNQIANCNDTSPLPNKPPSNSLQGSPLVTCGGAAPSESSGVNNDTETRQEMDILEASTATMKLEIQQKQQSAQNKKGVSRKRKGRGRQKGRKKKITTMVDQDNVIDQGKKRGRGRPKKIANIVDQGITVPDSTGTQIDCSVGLAENTFTVNSKTKSSPEPSVSSTSNGATDAPSMECKAAMHDDEEFVTLKKLKLEDNPIISPSNLVTSTSSDNVENVVNRNICTLLGDDNTVSRPLSSSTEPHTVASTTDEGNSSVNDGKVPSRGAGKPIGINKRKYQRSKKRKNMIAATVMKSKKVDSNDNELEGVEANGDVNHNATGDANHNVTNVDTKERTQNRFVFKPWESVRQSSNEITHEEPLQEASAITTCIKFEPEAHTLSHIPVTKDRWV